MTVIGVTTYARWTRRFKRVAEGLAMFLPVSYGLLAFLAITFGLDARHFLGLIKVPMVYTLPEHITKRHTLVQDSSLPVRLLAWV